MFGYADCKGNKHGPRTRTQVNGTGKQRALSPDTWLIPTKGSKIGYSCVRTMVVVRKKNVLSTRFNTCPPYFKEESKITRDLAAQ